MNSPTASADKGGFTGAKPHNGHNGDRSIEKQKELFPELYQRHKGKAEDDRSFELTWELLQLAKKLDISFNECQSLWVDYCKDKSHPVERVNTYKRFFAPLFFLGNYLPKVAAEFAKWSLLFGAIMFISEANTREITARNQSWGIINSAKDEKTSSGRIEALQQLNQGCWDSHKNFNLIDPSSWLWFREVPLVKNLYRDCISLSGMQMVEKVKLNDLQLPHADLQDSQFSKATLKKANFQGANLTNVKLTEAILNNSNFENSTLKNAQLDNANLSYVNFRNAQLIGINFTGADLSNADLRRADLTDAKVIEAFSLIGVLYNCDTKPFSEGFSSWLKDRKAYFIDSNPERCGEKATDNYSRGNFAYRDLSNTNLTNYILDRANLQGTNLRGSQLGRLRKANLRGADLREVNLQNADIQGAIYDRSTRLPLFNKLISLLPGIKLLEKAYLIEPKVQLQKADLEEADLQGANLQGADLSGANLKRANLRGADLDNTKLNADFRKAIYDINTKIPTEFRANFEERAYKIDRESILEKANLQNADLQNAYLEKAQLNGADLTGSDLSGSRLNDASLQGATLNEVNLSDAQITGAKLNKAQLKNASLQRSILANSILNEADLTDANLHRVDLRKANLKDANLQDANLKDADLDGADLSGADGLSVDQIKEAKNYQKAMFDKEFAQKLGI